MSFNFSVLDPRNIPAAVEANEKLFSGPVYGIEVTIPALAKRCVANLDPQHTGGDASRAAIEDAVMVELPSEGITLVTVRADLDAVGAMAVFSIRAKGEGLESAKERINMVATADKFARGGWPGRREVGASDGDEQLAAIASAVSNFKVPLSERVAMTEKWLLTGEEPAGYRARVEAERAEIRRAIAAGEIKVSEAANGRIAVVESTHRAATSVGYCLAPVVVARNPAFKLGGGESHVKFTICQFAGGFVDIRTALAALAQRELGWGGSPTIGGSPQGVSSTLTTDHVVEVVVKHLK